MKPERKTNPLAKYVDIQFDTLHNSIKLMLLSFFGAMLIMAAVYYIKGIYPNGAYTVLASDMGAQYMPFWASLRYLGKNDNSLFLNLSGALGNNFWGFAYYIFSPFAWITTLFSLQKLPIVIYFLTLIKIGMCGASFSYFLFYCNPRNRHKLAIVLLSLCYALMSYNVGYSINLMWLDTVLCLPWVLVGIERILNEKSPVVFVLSILLGLVWNYYITFMGAVFVVFYIFIRLVEVKKFNLKSIAKFAGYGLTGIGMAMPIILPGIIALENGKLEEETKPIVGLLRYRLPDLLGQFLSGRYSTLLDDGLPLFFCGTGTVALVLLYFVFGSDSIRIRALWLSVTLFYLVAFCFIPLDRTLQGFKETSGFECRYSFSFSCLLLILAYRGIDCVTSRLKKYSILFLIKILVSVFVLSELFMNASIIIAGIKSELGYSSVADYNSALELKTELLNCIEDDDFYRVSDYNTYTFNDGAWLGYNGMGYFSSCYNLSVMSFLGDLGENQSYHVLTDGQRTPLEESLLSVKYRIAYSEWNEDGILLKKNYKYSLYKNEYSLPLGYMVEAGDDSEVNSFTANAFKNQNILARELTGIEDEVFVELQQMNSYEPIANNEFTSIGFSVETVCDSPVWMYFENIENQNDSNPRTKLVVDGADMGAFIDPKSNSTYMIYLGRYSAGEIIDIQAFGNTDFNCAHVAYLDENVYHRIITKLDSTKVNMLSHSSGDFECEIDADNDGDLLFTLPYMDGWNIVVDGNKVPYKAYRNAFVVVPLSKGNHLIDIKFISPGVYTGLIIGVIAMLLFIVEILTFRKRDNLALSN